MKATIWHNPRCSKSRATLTILEAAPGVEVEVVEYLKTPPSRAEIETVLAKAGVRPSEALRKGEAVVKEIGLDVTDDKAVLDAMAQHPILIERAIVITDKGAVIARPPERVREVLKPPPVLPSRTREGAGVGQRNACLVSNRRRSSPRSPEPHLPCGRRCLYRQAECSWLLKTDYSRKSLPIPLHLTFGGNGHSAF